MIKVNVKGAIVANDDKWIYDMFDLESTSPRDISNVIEGQTDELEVIINSGAVMYIVVVRFTLLYVNTKVTST